MQYTHTCLFSFAATGQMWIINGQHTYAAAQEVRQQSAKAGRPAPTWTTAFRCFIIKPDTERDVVRMIAGRQQAKSQGIKAITFAQTAEVFWNAYKV